MSKYIRGGIYIANLPDGIGSEQSGYRPCAIVSNDYANQHSSTVTIVPITSKIKKKKQPTHILIKNLKALDKNSMVLCECLTTISKERIVRQIGTFNNRTIKKINEAILIAVSVKN